MERNVIIFIITILPHQVTAACYGSCFYISWWFWAAISFALFIFVFIMVLWYQKRHAKHRRRVAGWRPEYRNNNGVIATATAAPPYPLSTSPYPSTAPPPYPATAPPPYPHSTSSYGYTTAHNHVSGHNQSYAPYGTDPAHPPLHHRPSIITPAPYIAPSAPYDSNNTIHTVTYTGHT